MIEIRQLGKHYGAFQVLDACTASVAKGEVVVVCGPSGSGKSTLIKCVNGLEPFQSGQVVVGGISVGAAGTRLSALRARIGMVFQHFELFPHMSVLDNIVLAQLKVLGRRRDEAEARALALLDRVGLRAQAGKYPAALSGGQQQRVALARAIVARPRVLLFDEPLSNLDPQLRASLALEIRELLAQLGTTAVYVTHDRAEADTLAHRIVELAQGRVARVTQNSWSR